LTAASTSADAAPALDGELYHGGSYELSPPGWTCNSRGLEPVRHAAICKAAAAALKVKAGISMSPLGPDACSTGNMWVCSKPGRATGVEKRRRKASFERVSIRPCADVNLVPITEEATCKEAAHELGLWTEGMEVVIHEGHHACFFFPSKKSLMLLPTVEWPSDGAISLCVKPLESASESPKDQEMCHAVEYDKELGRCRLWSHAVSSSVYHKGSACLSRTSGG